MVRKGLWKKALAWGLVVGGASLVLHAVSGMEEEGQRYPPWARLARVASPMMYEPPPPSPPPPPEDEVDVGVVAGVDLVGAPSPKASHMSAESPAPRLILRGRLHLEVADPAKAREEVLVRLATTQGWVESQQENRDEDGHSSIRMTLRLPATSFEGARSGLRALGQVRHESQEAEDVSTEWVDREARLSVKRAAVTRLRQLLAQRTAGLKDLLAAERALMQTLEEIESMEAVHRLQSSQVKHATLELDLRAPRPAVASAAFHPLARLGERLVTRLGASLAVLVLVFVTLLPWAALAGLGLLIRRRIRAKAQPSPEIPDGSAAP